MIALKAAALAVCVAALFMTFKTNIIIEKVLHKEPTERMVLRVKYIALALAVIAFLAVFILGR